MEKSTIRFIIVMVLALGLILLMVVVTRSCSKFNPPKATEGTNTYTMPSAWETSLTEKASFEDDEMPVADTTAEPDPNAVTLPFVEA